MRGRLLSGKIPRMPLKRFLSLLVLVSLIVIGGSPAAAQDGGTGAPSGSTIHIVQKGETLTRIAIRYGITVETIVRVNGLRDPSAISVGQRLLIPNAAPGSPGIPTEFTVGVGDSFLTLVARFGVTPQQIAQQNKITNTHLLFIGQRINVLEGANSGDKGVQRGWLHTVAPDETIWRIALRYSLPVEVILRANALRRPAPLYVGQRLVIPDLGEAGNTLSDVPAPFVRATITPARIEQGRTVVFHLSTATPARLTGTFLNRTLLILSDASRTAHIALVGVDSLTPPGMYPLRFLATDDSGVQGVIEQSAYLYDGGYPNESITLPPTQQDLLNPAITEPEAERVAQIVSVMTAERYFGGLMGLPCSAPVTSQFGTRRSYNGGALERVHAGTDFAAMPGAAIYAAAPGRVVLADALTVRGNATIIDHGNGVFTGYWHQDTITVKVGDFVQAGQIIGTVGQTGRVTGPHLHWELFVNGVQVDPLQWTKVTFP